jgi:hypothetical protein
MKQFVKARLLILLVSGVLALLVQEAGAATVCKTYWSHGVKYTSCHKVYQPRTVCKTYWSHGVKYRSCRKVY